MSANVCESKPAVPHSAAKKAHPEHSVKNDETGLLHLVELSALGERLPVHSHTGILQQHALLSAGKHHLLFEVQRLLTTNHGAVV